MFSSRKAAKTQGLKFFVATLRLCMRFEKLFSQNVRELVNIFFFGMKSRVMRVFNLLAIDRHLLGVNPLTLKISLGIAPKPKSRTKRLSRNPTHRSKPSHYIILPQKLNVT
ncbi:MAG: hypothetical protein HN392_00115 [Anaerolineae bacterium]|jgi:hypothetical protein|nr:hypothetical protein [Anaerolineae bacterium]